MLTFLLEKTLFFFFVILILWMCFSATVSLANWKIADQNSYR